MSLIKKGVTSNVIKDFHAHLLIQKAHSRFKFLISHYGLRPGLAHGVLGTPGSGKSTLVKSMVADTAINMKCLIYLTEEEIREYQGKLDVLKCNMDNVVFLREKDIDTNNYPTLDTLLMYLFEEMLGAGIQALFWDNLTTSKIYEALKPNMQGYFFSKMQAFCSDNSIIFVYVAHTKQGISDNHRQMIEGEDMRGTAYAFTQSPYFYIFQRFTIDTKVYAFVHVRKHRFHELEHKHFLLNFKEGIYHDDRQLEFSALNEFFKQRNYLGKKGSENRREPSPRRERSRRDGDRDSVPRLLQDSDQF